MEKEKISDSIKKAREAKGITQQSMADRVGAGLGQTYSLRQYQRIEDGEFPKFKRSILAEIDKILGTSFTEAIYDKNVPREKHDESDVLKKYITLLEANSDLSGQLSEVHSLLKLAVAQNKTIMQVQAEILSGKDKKKTELEKERINKLLAANMGLAP